jgi:hypothetical protein
MNSPSITHNEKHFAKKTTLKLDESLKKIIFGMWLQKGK